jgi:RNA-binding protein 8A
MSRFVSRYLIISYTADQVTHREQGYALVEYETREEAEKAIAQAPQEPLLEQELSCDFAFVRPPVG